MLTRHAPSPLKTLGAVMAAGRTTGFDYLRLGLATAVLCSHSIDVSYGVYFTIEFENGPIRPLIAPPRSPNASGSTRTAVYPGT